ncbi:MAG TPA: alpha/beta fold hydrolase [Pseudonocardiaceae bacterium]|jgi:medium-chain acyl-[acyl-carrier-protein] hydrolase|nr:alpha/beta fold hydrolase [Pseudonocardiaceae bacterium]
MTGVMTNLWFPRVAHRRWPRVRLLCVGGAGTGPAEFAGWSTELPGAVELWPAQLPGRERRIREAPAPCINELADDIAEQMWQFSDPSLPWALFGHSFGSLVVYEVAKRIVGVLPMCGLIVSSMVVPHRQGERLPVRHSDDDTLLDWVRNAGGTDSALLDDPRFASWLAEDLRVTLRIRQEYSPRRPAPLPSPILALGGADDPDALPEDLAQWCEYTSKSFAYQQIGSGHFFLRDNLPDVVGTVAAQLADWTEPVAAYR